MIVAVLALGAFYVRALGLTAGPVVLLLFAAAVDRFVFPVGSIDLRAEEVAAVAVVLLYMFLQLRRNNVAWLRPSLAEGLLVAWFACNVLSSLIASPDRRLSAKIIALVAVCATGFVLPRRLLAGERYRDDMEIAVRWLLVIFATESLYGSLAYLLHVFGPTISLTPNLASGHLAAYGTLWEQNVFGAFAAAGGVAWSYLGPARFKNAWVGVAACTGGLIDSITRSAWLVAAVVGALGVALPSLRRRLNLAALGPGAIGGIVLIAATLAVDRLHSYVVPVPGGGGRGTSNLLTAIMNVVDVVGRFNQISPVLDDIHGHLILGRGTASFEALHVAAGVPEHIASLPLLVLNDTGIVGLIVFLGFAAAIVAAAWSRRTELLVVGLGQMAIVIGLTNLATQTTELMVDWLLLGMLMAAVAPHGGVAPARD